MWRRTICWACRTIPAPGGTRGKSPVNESMNRHPHRRRFILFFKGDTTGWSQQTTSKHSAESLWYFYYTAGRRVCQAVCRTAKNLRHDLTKDGRACIIKKPPDGGREGDATKTVGGSATSSERGWGECGLHFMWGTTPSRSWLRNAETATPAGDGFYFWNLAKRGWTADGYPPFRYYYMAWRQVCQAVKCGIIWQRTAGRV